ncbi:MAG: hypothetical protein Q8L54_05900 [Devosia sp.]|nr:hypothetical protein [Devosia sp.]
MRNDSTGRRPAVLAVARTVFAPVALLLALAVSACTTTEGTNAMTDFGTFEREVMTSTLQGLGMVDRQEKEETNQRRAPLVLPKQTASLPPPTEEKSGVLPVDSSNVRIDTTGLSEEDIKRLRNARVVDLRTLSGRPLTDVEAKQLTARMTAAQLKSGPRPLYLPPEEYFTVVDGKNMVCLAKNGDLVPLTDKACPAEIRKALQAARPTVSGGGILGDMYTPKKN